MINTSEINANNASVIIVIDNNGNPNIISEGTQEDRLANLMIAEQGICHALNKDMDDFLSVAKTTSLI